MQMPHSDLTSSSYNEVQFIISACVALWNSCALILTLDLQLSLRTVKIFSAHEWKTLGNAFSWTYMLQKKIISELLPDLQVEKGFSYTFCKKLRPAGDDLPYFCSSVALTMKHGENGFMKRQYCFHFWLLKKPKQNKKKTTRSCFSYIRLWLCKALCTRCHRERSRTNAEMVVTGLLFVPTLVLVISGF